MIEYLYLRNFQRHASLRIDFDPHVTCLVGPSDRGKSAALRALRWLASNRPAGDDFRRHGRKKVAVELGADGHVVSRSRGEKNAYALDGKEFLAFGTGVPPEVEALLNLGAVNFQGQHDPPFWLSLPPGDLGRELNAVVDLSLIDLSAKNIALARKHARDRVTFCEERVSALRLKLTALAWVPAAAVEADRIDRLRVRHTDLKARHDALAALLDSQRRSQREVDDLSEYAADSERLADLARGIVATRRKRTSLEALLAPLARLEAESGSAPPKGVWECLERSWAAYKACRQKYAMAASFVRELREREDERCRMEDESTRIERRLEGARSLLPTCPRCGRSGPASPPSGVPTSTSPTAPPSPAPTRRRGTGQ